MSNSGIGVTVGDRIVEEFDALLGYGFEIRDVLMATGQSYEAARLNAKRQNRPDLVTALKDWKAEDSARRRRACGEVWW